MTEITNPSEGNKMSLNIKKYKDINSREKSHRSHFREWILEIKFVEIKLSISNCNNYLQKCFLKITNASTRKKT